ncbi:MAG: hypothetical protein HY652_10360, partial [Acidobacteria bacterium]|nr:hypothetical protein [Acidobacteriota bacterium]
MELVPPSRGATVVLGFFVALAALVVLERSGGEIGAAQGMKPAGHPQLVSIQPLPEMDGEICQVPVSASAPLLAGFGQAPAGARVASAETARGASPSVRLARDPVRIIRDLDASFSTVAVDVERDEVVAGAENTFQILVYDRRANTPPGARMTEPKRALGGDRTKIDYICGLHVDPRTGEIYALNDDTETTMSVYSREARGNVPADRELKTPIYTFGLAVDEENEELYMTVQREGAVVVFRKMAAGDEPPLRLLQGDRTRLADPHGIAIDPKNDLMFVTNFGSVASRSTEGADLKKAQPKPNWPVDTRWVIPGSGRFSPASITVYRRTASGDTAPLRAIEG